MINWLRRLLHRHDWVNDDNPHINPPIHPQHCTRCPARSLWDQRDKVRFGVTEWS